MRIEVILPRLSSTMETGVVETWLKADGDTVIVGDALCEVATDKVTTEIEATSSGRLEIVNGVEGMEIHVGTVIAHIISD